MTKRSFVSVLVCLAVVAQSAAAGPMSARKPVTTQGSSGAPTLQQILDGLVVSGPAISESSAQNIQLWTNTSTPMTAQIVADFTGNQKVKFGIYDSDHPDQGQILLQDNMKPSDIASAVFNDDQTITIKGGKSKKGNNF